MATYFNVVYRGKMIEGFDIEAAKRKLVEKFAVSIETAEKILKSRRAVLKKAVDEATARKLGLALKRAGLDVALTPVSATTETPDPAAPSTVASAVHAGAPAGASQDHTGTPTEPPAAAAAARDSVPVAAEKVPFEFNGNGTEYFKIWLVNILLTIVTLGIYSAWAKVRRKQYFYGSTRLQGSSFEYLADPVKILKGRAIAVGFLLLHTVVSNLVPLLGLVLTLALLALLPWLVVRALAFNARNSALRNIRFNFKGTLKESAKAFILWPVLATFTLGILLPYAFYRQKKFIVENSAYGSAYFHFSATAKDYYRIVLSALIPALIGIVLMAGTGFLVPPLAILVGLALYLYLFALFAVKTTNVLFNTSRLAAHRFEADLKIKDYMLLLLTNSIGIALTLGLFHPWAKVRTMRYKLEHIALVPAGDLDGFIAEEQKQVSALGDEFSDIFDFDIGL